MRREVGAEDGAIAEMISGSFQRRLRGACGSRLDPGDWSPG